jgi:hypothetical protein
MRTDKFKAMLKVALRVLCIFPFAAVVAFGQQVNLTAGPTSLTLPDGTTVPMWGYSCGTPVSGSTATCAPLNPRATGWSPVVITAVTGSKLTINLTNHLSFGSTPNNIPTSIVIVGQLGGGLGDVTQRTTTPSPVHADQFVTWSTVGNSTGAQFVPPAQGPRVQSFGTEVAATPVRTTQTPTALTWNNLRPGTYLIESGTHPSIQGPMGLYGILVVTNAPATVGATGTAYPNVIYNAEIPMLFGEIDPVQNTAVNTAVNTAGFSETAVITLKDSVSGIAFVKDTSGNPIAGSGYRVGDVVTITGGGGIQATAQVAHVTATGVIIDFTVTNAGSGYTSVPSATVTSSTGSGAQVIAVLSLAGDLCGNGTPACYPPAVNFTPLYYAINGVAFNKTNASASVFPATAGTTTNGSGMVVPVTTGITGNVLVRLVNAGLRMHVPSIVGSVTTPTTTASAVGGFSLIAEDGNVLPGIPRVQSEVFMAAGKTYDVMIKVPTGTQALPVYDRELSLSGNKIGRDAGMLAYISVNGAALPSSGALAGAVARQDTYNAVIPCTVAPCKAVTVSDPAKGVIANDTNVYGVAVATGGGPTGGTLTLNTDGTFTYVPNVGTTSDSFSYCANGTTPTSVPSVCAPVTLGACTTTSGCLEAANGIKVNNISYTSKVATYLKIAPPGVLSVDSDGKGYPLSIPATSVVRGAGLTLWMDPAGGFTASVSGPGTYYFGYSVKNSQGTSSATAACPADPTATPVPGCALVTLNFPTGSGLNVQVLDGQDKITVIGDYRWIIEEDRTFYVDPTKTTNTGSAVVPTYGVNFHTSNMPFVAQGCTGPKSCESGQTVYDPVSKGHVPALCDIGNGVCRPDPSGTGNGTTPVMPSQVYLDPTKRYYISVLPGDAAIPFQSSNTTGNCQYGASAVGASNCGHGMGGAPITFGQRSVTILSQPSPYPPAKLSVFVFEDDSPLNGEHEGGGGVDAGLATEPGLGGFQLHLWDAFGGNGDFSGQMTYDMFNQPLTNSLAGQKDPSTGFDACPISVGSRTGTIPDPNNPGKFIPDPTQTGITGMIVTCPKYESDGKTLSPLAGQAVIANLMPGRWGVIASPAADRIARGEEWLQTNTLDGQKAHDSFTRIGEPSFFQEYGPASYHVSIGFANPKIINSRLAGVCSGNDPSLPGAGNCHYTVKGKVTGERLSRTPDERLYSSGSHDAFYWTQCFASLGDPDGEDFAFAKCDADGNFTFTGIPAGDWRVSTFDQWNDQLVDGLSTPVRASGTNTTIDMGDVPATQWQTNLYTRTFMDDNKDGLSQKEETGIPLLNVAVRLRDGSLENLLLTDFTGTANFNETFPLFSWYVVETDTTRYKNTGTHVVYDAGGPADGSASCGQSGFPACGTSTIGKNLANTAEKVSLPPNLRVPGAVYCDNADCNGFSILNGPGSSASANLSTGRIDPPWVGVEGWQGFPGQNSFLEFGKEPYAAGENGGIKGHVIYASTRPFDDPQMLVQTQWEPLVPRVTINLYQEGTAKDGITPTLTLVDTTQTSSWDDWAQGFRPDGTPNMSCPGQTQLDLFFFTLKDQPDYLDVYNNQHSGTPLHPLPNDSQYKCYDGMHNWNQLQPAPYDGMYKFPSVTAVDGNGKPTLTGTNCTICKPNTVVPSTDLYYNTPMLPIGKYVVEIVLPAGFELVKEEDKNILIGDNFIAPVTQQFGGIGNIFILPDQASVASSYNSNNPQNPTQSFGAVPNNWIVPGFVPEPTWPCVGEARIVPDYISLYPWTNQVAPFAGATRNLCDRKEVTLSDQMGAIAKFFIYTSTHIASKFTGGITDDYTSEFDPFSPVFGEKFAPPNMPISVRDWSGAETARVYSDHWGAYDGMTYSTWEVNPPNPTGYSPTMMIFCMNDPGTGAAPDPLFNPAYSQFCYELPFMPGTTQYLDTPVVPTSAFAGGGYNNVDCAYPATTPAIKEVDGDGVGPYVSTYGHTLTITALSDQLVNNYAYSGPSATTAPFNQKTVLRHYGFGNPCTAPTTTSATCNTATSVTIGGIPAAVTSWTDSQIIVTVPGGTPSTTIPACGIQQQAIYQGSPAQCGELIITAGNGKQSIDTVTVTVGGKAPTHVSASGTIQSAIDGAMPGDLIIVDPTCTKTTTTGPQAVSCPTAGGIPTGTTTSASMHNELLLMWKPVRLQGVGAASSIINANAHPAGKLDPWRRQVTCLFGLTLNGTPLTATNKYDSTGLFTCPSNMQFQVDRLPLEATVGWDANLNGNLAELLQEPTLMGALEGAGITVLSKGVDFHGQNPFASDVFPDGTTLLTSANCLSNGSNPFPSNFWCNPSSIDALAITNSSQGGGGIFVHAWGHNLEIANDRVYNNSGTLSGGINVGQGEFPPALTVGGTTAPGSCVNGVTPNQQLPDCFDMHVNVHHNAILLNSSTGDELFSATPAGAGGVSFCTGSDYYKFNYNWVCGNLSTGDGGGVGHIGFIYNGDIEHNTILFNQSTNPSLATNGGGILVMGAPDADPPCGAVTDQDCVPATPNPPSDGAGPGLVINANLIMGNAAESGSGGGIRLQGINGTDVITFPMNPLLWYSVQVTNNIIADNVAGWDGAGISLEDALAVDIVNNTIMSNDSTATSGVLFNTLGAPLASSQGPTCTSNCGSTSAPQPAGLVAVQNSAQLTASLPTTIVCPVGHAAGTGSALINGTCRNISYPRLYNDIFWQNRSFYIGVGGAVDPKFQQNVVTLYNAFTSNTPASQGTAGACVSGSSYWDIGVRGDTGPGKHDSTYTLAPVYSVLTNTGAISENGLGSSNMLGANPAVVSQYCDGSRIPPEFGGMGYQVPPGISDATVPNPVFNLTPAATVDEGNNWVNISWGPLAETNPVTGATLGNYSLTVNSPAIDYIPFNPITTILTPNKDFFGNPRPETPGGNVDVGAVEFQGVNGAAASVWPTSLAFGNVVLNNHSATQMLNLRNTGSSTLTNVNITVATTTGPPAFTRTGGTCSTTLNAGASCTIIVGFQPTATSAASGSVTITGSFAVTGSPVLLTGTGIAAPGLPSLNLLDNFNRANANTLGGNWTQPVVSGSASIRVDTNQAFDVSSSSPGAAVWNAAFAGKQGAAFTIVNTTVNNDALILAATGPFVSTPTNFVRVSYNAGTVSVATTTNAGFSYTTIGTLASPFSSGDTITAVIDGTAAVAAPTVYVWRTTAANVTTFVGAAQIPPSVLWQSGGQVGMQLPNGARVDNFAGGIVP